MNWFSKLRILFLIGAAILLVLSYKVANLTESGTELQRGADLLDNRVKEISSEIEHEFSHNIIGNEGSQKRLSKEFLDQAAHFPYEVLIYKNDSLSFWSDNNVVPAQPISSFSDSIGFEKLANGYYLTFKKTTSTKSGRSIALLALAPVKYDYITENVYLRNHFSKLFGFPSYFDVSLSAQDGYLPITTPSHKTLFYLGITESQRADKPGLISPLLFLAALLLFMLFMTAVVGALSAKIVWLRPLIWAIVFAGLAFYLNHQSWLPEDVSNWNVFNPVLFASSGIATSIGALFVELLILLWISIDLTYNFQPRLRLQSSSILNYILHLIGYFTIFFMVIYSVSVIKALVLDSLIEFAFINPLRPDYFSILGVLTIAVLLLSLFLLSEKIISILYRNSLNVWDRILMLLICTTSAITYYFLYNIGISGMWVMLWTIVFILLLSNFRITRGQSFTFSRLFLWLVFFASSGAILLFYYGESKEKVTRLAYAKKLISDRDAVTEFLLGELRPRIESDSSVASYFKSQHETTRELSDRLQQLYFQEGFSRYSIRFFPFDNNQVLLPGWGEDFGFVTENGLRNNKYSASDELYYSLSSSGNITYIAEYDIRNKDSLLGKLFVELKADVYKSASVYPELLLPDENRLPSSATDYSYAIYNNKQLIDHHGNIYYDYKLSWDVQPNMEVQYKEDAYGSHLIYSPLATIVIVVSKANNSLTYFLSFFSFLFVVMFILGIAVLAFSALHSYPSIPSFTDFFKEAPLRSLIHAFFLVFILIMLVLIGYVTGQYFLQQFNKLAKTTVHEKMDRISESMRFLLQQNKNVALERSSLRDLIRSNISELSEEQDNEVNIYDRAGDLIASSQPSIFEKGIISKKINPRAFFELKKETKLELVTDEQIGDLKFYSGYVTIRNSVGTPLLFINLPYYNSRKNLNDQVGFFFIALVNILVIATIIAGSMAPLISKQITSRLALIADKFKKVNVGATNETIDWPAKDEIGSLVNEYNKMIAQLGESAQKLAYTQRQLAWREMARQVAHEIKNPLTPMKLSIQHLLRAYQNNAPNLKELTENVARNLIEQIDTLSEIASEFSNYASMPKAALEDLDVNDILRTTCELYMKNDFAAIHLHNNADRSTVEADKGQLIRVFNNLLLNAIQSIPDDRHGEVNVITENIDGQIVISVRDNGVGIPDDEISKVFIPNFTTKSSGTGLGLALSKNIIESFGGTIYFNTQKNAGTTFFVRLPLIENGRTI